MRSRAARVLGDGSAANPTEDQGVWNILRARHQYVESWIDEVKVLQRILLAILVLYVVWRLVTAWGRRLAHRSPGADSYSRFRPDKRRQRTDVRAAEPEQLVPCARCGTYVPARRALTAGGSEVFCSPECRDVREVAVATDDRSS